MPKLQPWQTKRLFALGSGWDRSSPTNRDNNRYLAEVSPCSQCNGSCGGPLGQKTCLNMPWSPWEKKTCYDEIWGKFDWIVVLEELSSGCYIVNRPFLYIGIYGATMRAMRTMAMDSADRTSRRLTAKVSDNLWQCCPGTLMGIVRRHGMVPDGGREIMEIEEVPFADSMVQIPVSWYTIHFSRFSFRTKLAQPQQTEKG